MWKVKSKKIIIWKFWHGLSFMIVLHMLVYFFAFQGGKWVLQIANLKKMCLLFTAFDRVST